MASFRFTRVPEENVNIENIESIVEDWSVRDGNDRSGQGAIEETLNVPTDDTAYFKYANWVTTEVEQLDEVSKVQKCKKRVMGILNGNLLFIEKAGKEYQKSMVGMFQREFTSGVNLELEEFKQSALRIAETEAKDLLQAKFLPDDRMEPDSVKIADRDDIRGTDSYDRHDGEELEKLKMSIKPDDQELRLGFKNSGLFTVYHRDLRSDQKVAVLRANYELLVRMLDKNGGTQSSWGSWDAESGSESESDD